MDEQRASSALYKARGFSGRLSESFKFLEKNFKELLKMSMIGLAPLLLLCATALTLMPVAEPGTGMLAVGMVLMIVLWLATMVYFRSFIYAALERYGETGFLPAMKPKGWWPLMKAKAGRVLLCDVVMIVLMGICLLIVLIPLLCGPDTMASGVPGEAQASMPLRSILITALMAILFIVVWVPPALVPGFYLLGRRSLQGSFVCSFKLGFQHWGSTFGMILFAFILYAIVSFIGSLPYSITVVIDSLVATAAGDGTVVSLPWYYLPLKVVLTFLMLAINYIASLLFIVPQTFQYASLVTMEKEQMEAETTEAV